MVAIKREKEGMEFTLLEHEAKVLKLMKDIKGFPQCKGIIRQNSKRYMVM
jgi:hypothetical protein